MSASEKTDALSAEQEGALTGPDGPALRGLMAALSLGRPLEPTQGAVVAGRRLGWLTPGDPPRLTPEGMLAADPLREYQLWIERGRRGHAEGQFPELERARFAGQRVLEVGCSWGVNLFPLAGIARELVGLEPQPIYRRFAPLFAALEGIACPRIVDGSAERMPLPEGAFDAVLLFSVHQYTDVRRTFAEVARVLRPAGRFVFAGGHLSAFVRRDALSARSPGAVKSAIVTVANTLAYQASGRRLLGQGAPPSTRFPIYPARRALARWLAEVGLEPVAHFAPAGGDPISVWRKR